MTNPSNTSLLFVCVGNTCRSVMAEAFAKRRFGSTVSVSSAGLKPQQPEDASNAIDTLKEEFSVDASGHTPRDVRSLDLESFTVVVAMDKSIAKQVKGLTSREIIVWQIDDPWGDDSYEYLQCALKIKRRVHGLAIAASAPAV